MRKITVSLAAFGALLVNGCLAYGQQTTLVDTIGNGARWGFNSPIANGRFIGDDPGPIGSRPYNAAGAGYAVLPFTLTGLSTPELVNGLSISMNIQPPDGTKTTSSINLLSGAIVEAPAVGSLSATGLLPSNFFGFDTSVNIDPFGTGKGDNLNHLYSAVNPTGPVLQNGKTYWLVIAPKRGLNAQDTEDLLTIGLWEHRVASDITASGASLNNGIATVGQGLHESLFNAGAQSGDLLKADKTPTNLPFYFGAKIVGVSAVPEPTSAAAMLLGAGSLSLTLVRRRARR